MTKHVLVIGGGIAGLSAALRLHDDGHRVTIVEQSKRLGGKIRTGEVAGLTVETGAESFLVRRDEAVRLAERTGLADSIVYPNTGVPSALTLDGTLHDLPRRTVMGIPAAADDVAAVISPSGRDGIAAELPQTDPLLEPHEDISVGSLVTDRFGREITDRLVDPLLGGVYAAGSDSLSLEATIPTLARAVRGHTSLKAAVSQCLPSSSGSTQPVFGSTSLGLSQLVSAVATVSQASIQLGLPVRQLCREGGGWRAVVGPTVDPRNIFADAVVLAVPAKPASRLLSQISSSASVTVGELDYTSVALVTLALPTDQLPQRSGLLVPESQGFMAKAATFVTRKWPHLDRGELSIVRMSYGRHGHTQVLQREDSDLVSLAHSELTQLLMRSLPTWVDATVTRWGGGLPRYAPGHLSRISQARVALADQPIALAGAAFDGVGIPACIASGTAAAVRVSESLRM